MSGDRGVTRVRVEEIRLVEGHKARLVPGAELIEDGLDGGPVFLEVTVGGIDDFHQNVCAIHFVEGRPEGLHELVWQLVDEANGIGHDRRLAVAELDLAAGRIERREEFVLRLGDLAADERVEQGGLAGVGITDDPDGGPQPTIAAARRRFALLPDLSHAFLHLGDARPHDAPVRFELRFARAACADPATRPAQVGPQLGQARQLVLELRELHLEATFVGGRVEGEDVEDQPAAVDDLDLEQFFERPLLRRRQLVVGDQDVKARLAFGGRQFLCLALADVPVRIDMAAVLPFGANDFSASRRSEVGELGQRVLRGPTVVLTGVDGDEEDLLGGRNEVDEVVWHRPKDSRSGRGASVVEQTTDELLCAASRVARRIQPGDPGL